MYYTTEDYRQEMKEVLRGHTSVNVYMSLINNVAQTTAHITSSFSGDESTIYDNALIEEDAYIEYTTTVIPESQASISGTVTTLYYAHFDDTTTVIHTSSSGEGVTSTENDGSITFEFGEEGLNIAGLTITFKTKPTSITVTNGVKTVTTTVEDLHYVLDSGFRNSNYIKITPNSGKLSLTSILFGIKLYFNDRYLKNTSRYNSIDHTSNELPCKMFTFTIDNNSHLFNKDNPNGYADYIQEKQEVVFEYGHDMPDGSVYLIKGGKVLLNNWTSDDTQAKFTSDGRLDYLNGTFYKGQYYENGISAYSLIEFVMADAGETHYKLDNALKNVVIYNPIPVCTHREALQYIANASRCILYEDRDGNISIMNANRPSFIYDVEFVGETEYTIGSTLFEDNSANNYADAENNYADASGTMLFLPESESYISVGFVSSEISSSTNVFQTNPSMDIAFKAQYHMTGMTLNFAYVCAKEFSVQLLSEGLVVDSVDVTNNSNMSYTFTSDELIDEIVIAFAKTTNPYQRIHLNNISLDGYMEYELTKRDLKTPAVASSLDLVSKVNVHSYTFAKESTEEGTSHNAYLDIETTPNEDGGDTIDLSLGESEYGSSVASVEAEVGENLVILNNAYYNYKVTAGTIVESGAYYLIVDSDIPQQINVFANPYNITDNVFTLPIREKGIEKDLRNQLVGTQVMARQLASFLKGYYDDDLQYSITYRGEPAIDADDLIMLQSDFVSLNEIRITEETLNTSMGLDFNCTLVARRNRYIE